MKQGSYQEAVIYPHFYHPHIPLASLSVFYAKMEDFSVANSFT